MRQSQSDKTVFALGRSPLPSEPATVACDASEAIPSVSLFPTLIHFCSCSLFFHEVLPSLGLWKEIKVMCNYVKLWVMVG